MIREMRVIRAEALGHIEIWEKELAPHLGANVPEVNALKQVLIQKRAELEANHTAAGERILDRISSINVSDDTSDPAVELKYFDDEWTKTWLSHSIPDPKNVRGQIEKAKTDKQREISDTAAKAKEDSAQTAPPADGDQAKAKSPSDSPPVADEQGALSPEEQRKQIIASGECDGDVALSLIKETFGTVKKQPERGEVQYISQAELKTKWNAVYGYLSAGRYLGNACLCDRGVVAGGG